MVIGRSGQVASELRVFADRSAFRVHCHGRETADLAHFQEIDALLARIKPALVINAAAYTAVDAAETARDRAFAVNCHGAANLAEGCHKLDIPLVHISTDYIFDGHKKGAYREDDPVNPVNVYGASKAAGETAVRERHDQHVILRTSWLYSPYGNNFVKTMLRLGAERKTPRVVDDQFGCPTAAADIVRAIFTIAADLLDGKTDGFGTFHYCGAGAVSWFQFAEEIFRVAAQKGEATPLNVTSVSTSEYGSKTTRPANTELNCDKIRDKFGIELLSWRESLEKCIERITVVGIK